MATRTQKAKKQLTRAAKQTAAKAKSALAKGGKQAKKDVKQVKGSKEAKVNAPSPSNRTRHVLDVRMDTSGPMPQSSSVARPAAGGGAGGWFPEAL